MKKSIFKILILILSLWTGIPSVSAQELNSIGISSYLEIKFSYNYEECETHQCGLSGYQAYLHWSRPMLDEAIGHWGNAVAFWDTNLSGTLLETGNGFTGTYNITNSDGLPGAKTEAGIVNEFVSQHYRVRSTLIKPNGEEVVFVSDSALANNFELAQLDIAEEPEDIELKIHPEKNAFSCGDPVYLHSGQFYYQCPDFSIPGRQMDLMIEHTYYSGISFNGPFGYGWMFNFYTRLHHLQNGDVMIVSGDARKTRYTFDGQMYRPPAGRFEVLNKNADGTWTLSKANGDTYTFDSDGKLTVMADRNNNEITFTYDAEKQPHYGYSRFSQDPSSKIMVGLDYRLTAITDTTGRTIQLTYNADGLLDKIIDGGREISFTYDPQTNDLLSVTKPATDQLPQGVTKTFTYENHNATSVEDAKGQVFVRNFYDEQGRVERQNLGGADMLFDYSADNQVTATDRNGNETVYAFNTQGNMIRQEQKTRALRAGDPAAFVTSYTYNADSLKTSETLPRGNGVVYRYDETNPDPRGQGNLLEMRRKTDMSVADNDTEDIVTSFAYEPLFNQPKQIIDPKGFETTYTFDYELGDTDPDYGANGNVVTAEQPAVTGQGTPVTRFSYNAYGQVIRSTDPNGHVTTYDYFTDTGYLKEIHQDPDGIDAVTQFTYDINGNPDTVTDANGHVTDTDYNELNQLVQSVNALGYVTKTFYDANGNVERVERQMDEAGEEWQVTEWTYDILNHVKTMTDPLGRVTAYNYDANENMVSMVDAEGNAVTNEYDERNLLFKVTDANTPAGVTRYDYDANGNLAKITDAAGHPTSYAYDLFDRLHRTTYADGSITQSSYDKNSNLDFLTLPGTHGTIDYQYDELNRLTAKLFPQHPARDMYFTYDIGSRLLTADNEASQIAFAYDALNRVTDNSQTLASAVYNQSYGYDAVGNRQQFTTSTGQNIAYDYDALDRLTTVGVPFVLAEFQYDPLNRRTQKILNQSQHTLYTYDAANQLISLTNQRADTGLISRYAYPDYDAVGNRLQLVKTVGTNPQETINYAYNDIYELTSVTGAQNNAYDYDNVGNREIADSTAYASNSLNQYENVGGTLYFYDDNGNLTSDGNNTYVYDELNRLVQATTPQSTTTYQYDAFNRRVAKMVDGETTYYFYDGDSVVAEADESNIARRQYVYSDRIDEMILFDVPNTAGYFPFYDGLGSVTDITNVAGNVVEHYDYDAYGNVSILNTDHGSLTTSFINNPYYFTGRRLDDETGLYYYRARQYDPMIGRFLQRDPIGIRGGINLYGYVHNNPINLIDPLGLKGTFSDNFRFSMRASNDFFFGGPTRFTRSAIGFATAGTVANATGLRTFGMAVSEFARNARTYAPHLGMASAGVAVSLGGSVAVNSLINAGLVAGAVEAGIIGGSFLDAIFQTYFVPEDEISELNNNVCEKNDKSI